MTFMAFVAFGTSVIIARCFYEDRRKYRPVYRGILDNIPPRVPTFQSRLRKLTNATFVPFTLCLLVGGLLLPAQPCRQMTSTLLVDIVRGITSVVVTKGIQAITGPSGHAKLGSNPLGNLNYNPWDDPYYISNLDSPIDPFIAGALDGVQFKNIVHIVLESVRADCFPFKEQSPFVDYIKENFRPRKNGSAITTANITPFIDSLAEHTLSWETMWTLVPFTHKALLARKHRFYSFI